MKRILILLICLFTIGASSIVNTRCPRIYPDTDLDVLTIMNVSEDPLTDSSGNSHTAAVEGATYTADGGKFGGGYIFDGGNDYINYGDDDCFTPDTNGWSIGGWFYITDQNAQDLMCKYAIGTGYEWYFRWNTSSPSGYYITAIRDDGGSAYIARSTIGAKAFIPQNVWTFLVFTWAGGTGGTDDMKIYENGIRIDTTTDNSGIFDEPLNSNTPFWVGRSDHHEQFIKGTADEIFIKAYEMTAQEIKADYYRRVNTE